MKESTYLVDKIKNKLLAIATGESLFTVEPKTKELNEVTRRLAGRKKNVSLGYEKRGLRKRRSIKRTEIYKEE